MTLNSLPKINQILDGFHSTHLCFIDHSTARKVPFLHNYPQKWSEHYTKNDYYRHDTAFQSVNKSFAPFVWSQTDFIYGDTITKKIYDEARQYQLTSGVGLHFIEKDGHSSLLFLTSPERETSYRNFMKKEQDRLIPALFMFMTYLQLHQHDAPKQAQQNLAGLILQLQQQHKRRQRFIDEAYTHIHAFNAEVNRSMTMSSKNDIGHLCQIALKKLHHFCYKNDV